ncbi:MAG: SUMF1/EgtB/PvdO family nonheme iron enzyme, partial [Myxococcota bacterium]
AGPFGHDDMAGNVWEWTLDLYAGPFGKMTCVDCVVLSGGTTFAVRGGAFGSSAAEMTADTRTTFALPRGSGIGFRCALPPSWSDL